MARSECTELPFTAATMPPAAKRQKTAAQSPSLSAAASDDDQLPSNDEFDVEMDEGDADDGSDDGSDSPDTEDEIAAAQARKSSKTAKRKRRAVSPSRFGGQLQTLLGTAVPQEQPLVLTRSIAKHRAEEKAELKSRKAADVARREKEDKGRLTDVIGGWGGESERALRKVAQRGVVKLFNAIQQAQDTSATALQGKVARPDPGAKDKKKGKDNLLGRGKDTAASALDKDSFLSLIKSGGIVSKS